MVSQGQSTCSPEVLFIKMGSDVFQSQLGCKALLDLPAHPVSLSFSPALYPHWAPLSRLSPCLPQDSAFVSSTGNNICFPGPFHSWLCLWVWHKRFHFREARCVISGLQRTQPVTYTSTYLCLYCPSTNEMYIYSIKPGDIRQGYNVRYPGTPIPCYQFLLPLLPSVGPFYSLR